jgi:hypothetical protein
VTSVFLSQPAVRTPAQETRSQRCVELVTECGFRVETLARDGYALDPWRQLRRILAGVDGVVVLGLRQLDVTVGSRRPGTPEAAVVDASWSSPWMHLEAGLAVAAGLPVLVLAEGEVGEGVFDRRTWIGQVRGARLGDDAAAAAALDEWAAAVRGAPVTAARISGGATSGRSGAPRSHDKVALAAARNRG